jgi:hypothetical protein
MSQRANWSFVNPGLKSPIKQWVVFCVVLCKWRMVIQNAKAFPHTTASFLFREVDAHKYDEVNK